MTNPKTVVIKYGGNAMKNEEIQNQILDDIAQLHRDGHRVVLVHGGGPFINKILAEQKIDSEFIGGHRKTTTEAIKFIEMALTGEVNPKLVRSLQSRGVNAVGLSGKDGRMVLAERKYHLDGNEKVDIGWVGEVAAVDPLILQELLKSGFFPVLTCMASDSEGNAYNINGDVFAGYIAGAIQADQYLVMTDVDGLCEDKDRPETLISHLKTREVPPLMGKVIAGGMIPKIDSCLTAINQGTKEVRIINGTKAGILSDVVSGNSSLGTSLTK